MKISEKGIEFLKQREGEKLTRYLDSVGKPTIGVGHLILPGEDYEHITPEQSTELLKKDLEWAEKAVNSLVRVALSQNQYDALVSFVFNVGEHALTISTLLKKLNSSDYKGAADEFLKWNMAGGKRIQGLANRRELEKKLFES